MVTNNFDDKLDGRDGGLTPAKFNAISSAKMQMVHLVLKRGFDIGKPTSPITGINPSSAPPSVVAPLPDLRRLDHSIGSPNQTRPTDARVAMSLVAKKVIPILSLYTYYRPAASSTDCSGLPGTSTYLFHIM
jgi:hypothetical protein